MENSKIEQLEEEIKKLHYEPEIEKHSFSGVRTKEFYNGFWDIHVKPVIEYSKQMAEKYEADKEAVWLAQFFTTLRGLPMKSRTMKSALKRHTNFFSKKALMKNWRKRSRA